MFREPRIDHHIGGEVDVRGADERIAALAESQHGVVARAQLLGAGVSRRAVERRVAAARLHLVHRGVYAVGHRRISRRGRWMAAVLAAGPGAVLSHRSAAALYGLHDSQALEVTVPARRERPGIRVHTARLAPDERTTHDAIPVTTRPARSSTWQRSSRDTNSSARSRRPTTSASPAPPPSSPS